MMRLIRIACALLALSSPALAQGAGQLGSGHLLGNSTASRAPGKDTSVPALFDRAFCSTTNAALFRNSTTWLCLTALPNAMQDNIVRLGTVTVGTLNGVAVTGLPAPSLSTDAVTKAYADGLASGLHPLGVSRLATAAVLPNTPTYANGAAGVGATLTAGANSTLTVDGTVAALNDVVLVKDQASAFQNGIYTVTTAGSGAAAWVLTRATYFDQAAEMLANSYTAISAGATNAGASYILQNTVTTVGTTAAVFVVFSSPAVVSFQGVQGAILISGNFAMSGSTLTLAKIGNECPVDGVHYTTLALAAAACASGGDIVVSIAQTLSATVTISAANTRISCVNGATFTATTSGVIVMNGSDSGVSDCTFVGPGTGTTSQQAIVGAGDYFYFRRNKVTGYGNTSGNGTVEVGSNNSHIEISNNVIRSNKDSGIVYVNTTGGGAATDIRIVNNEVGNGILVHSPGASSTVKNVVISGNDIYAGENSNIEFCVDVGAYGGIIVSAVNISGNHCYLTSSSTWGGYTLASIDSFSATGNTFDGKGFTFSIGAFELPGNASNGVVSDNSIVGRDGGNGIVCDPCNNVVFNGNRIQGFGTTSNNYGIFVGTNSATGIGSVTVTGNSITFSAGSSGRGIIFQCGNVGAQCLNNTIVGNFIQSDGHAGSIGIILQRDAGTMAQFLIGPNMILGPEQGISLTSGVSGFCLIAGRNTGATTITNASGNVSSCQ